MQERYDVEGRKQKPDWEKSLAARLNLGCFFIEEILKIYITTNSANLKVTIIAGVKFKNIRNTVAQTSVKNKVNLILQSTRQMPLFTSPGNWPISTRQVQLEYDQEPVWKKFHGCLNIYGLNETASNWKALAPLDAVHIRTLSLFSLMITYHLCCFPTTCIQLVNALYSVK